MLIATTLNINKSCLQKIQNAAQVSGKSCNAIIIILLKKVMDDPQYKALCGKQVRYQDRSDQNSWHRFHVRFRPDEYEYFLDLRKILKLSVSGILAKAANKYLPALLKENISDNYHFQNYIIGRETIDGIICWRLVWGYTTKILQFSPYPMH
jgi:hypothetical protein